MDDPDLYAKFNKMQYNVAKEILESHRDLLNKPKNAVILDIGCGDGKVTGRLLRPMLSDFNKIIAIDLSPKMIEHATAKYADEQMEFKPFNFCGEDNNKLKSYSSGNFYRFLGIYVGYDHITSFTALHWISNQTLVFSNIYDLLKPGGNCLISMIAFTSLYEAMNDLKEMEEWAAYTKLYDNSFPWQKSKDPIGECEQILKNCKFSEYRVDIIDRPFDYDSYDHTKSKYFFYQEIKCFSYVFLFGL